MEDKKFVTESVTARSAGYHSMSHQPIKPNMAVNSMDFNHKMDAPSIASGGVVSGSATSVQVVNANERPVSVDGRDDNSHSRVNNVSSNDPGNVKDNVTVIVMPAQAEQNRVDGRLQPGAVAQKMKELENMDVHRSTNVGLPTMGSQKPKKGSFQITSVINRKQQELDSVDHANEDADSIGDDFDETNTEDLSSEIMDTSKMTDIDQDPSSEDTVQSLVIEDLRTSKAIPNSLPPSKDKSRQESGDNSSTVVQSTKMENEQVAVKPVVSQDTKDDNDDSNFGATRFRIVKVHNERFVLGRWTVYDYQDSERTSREKSNEDLGSGNSSAASSVHYIPGVDDPTKNPFATASSTVYTDSSSMAGLPTPADSQLRHSVSQSKLINMVNGEYNAQTGKVHRGQDSSGTLDTPSSNVQSVSQPISSVHAKPSTVGYGTQSVGGGPTAQGSTIPKDFSTSQQDYMNQSATPAQPSSQPQSIPQNPTQPVSISTNTSSMILTGTSDSNSDVVGSSGSLNPQPQGGATGVDILGSSVTSNNPSPDNQGADFRPQDALYVVGLPEDQQSIGSTEEDRMSGGGMARALMSQAGLAQPLLQMVQTMQHPGNRDEDESGASTVAIDNKIEQAMDLVKSHLMFAVREEVLVLKEQIKELLEKNSQLEYENNVLRAGATPETLAKLSQATSTGSTQTSAS